MKILMVGVGGMLGEAFYDFFNARDYTLHCSDIDVNTSWLTKLDFRSYEEYRSAAIKFKPDFIFHIGAYTNLEYCELNPLDTYRTNTLSAEHAVTLSNELDIPMLYISTAGIFDGEKPLYDDWDLPNPLGVYARSKYMGERFVVENCRRYFVCRAGWMMGGGPKKDKKYISKIFNQIKAGARVLNVVDDRDGTPTYTLDFAKTCEALIRTNYYGVYNMVCGGQTSRLEVTSEILSVVGMSDVIEIKSVSSDFFKKQYFAARPVSERLINTKLKLRDLDYMRDWKLCLKEYIDARYSSYL
ncbi:SDR family oxidoreductase [Planktomarina temperata]|nr:SDR family oxidoreductase [bacterium]MDB2458908.1 SDR family oxidoreductase [Planktomarina temperata]